ncbi:DeoR/GlpR family DNA-binding transcription regulator [Sulfitobacter donghicola]|uniref:Transcriptional regulator n=1 Tax=Sulfitobacter donghicola DSW-25 = KCTC 12864 = JCM 14565 TaxID=1300350 RepID=A0A073IJW6_9RHOB|nr:DeoR/GlpR family DNA-binding transcription regulator [Sulfitobacter donghicola]KEJ89826.1 transcriptional regulator [Sulfitobacter donghicola DSW-25 = KCTC 12864 = JCM 14565]KIN67054.1 putative transcriptional regulator [Sulfitobacter donghicola DSW-25 = KCTC 12864 = JCM 14565]
MKVEKRQTQIIDMIRRNGKASVEDLAAHLSISRETIRRDLTQLSEAGKILKVHGGARMPRVMGEGPFKQRLSENVGAKIEIAKAAASLVEPGETLFVDTGSTTLYFAEAIAQISGLTVVTNSTEIARIMSSAKTNNRAFLLGGEFSADNSQTVGTMAVTHIRSFRAHHAFLTIGAMDARSGAMDYNIEEAQIARAMIEQSEMITVLADSSKLGALASFEVCPLGAIDRLVTDQTPPAEIHDEFIAAGGKVILSA